MVQSLVWWRVSLSGLPGRADELERPEGDTWHVRLTTLRLEICHCFPNHVSCLSLLGYA